MTINNSLNNPSCYLKLLREIIEFLILFSLFFTDLDFWLLFIKKSNGLK